MHLLFFCSAFSLTLTATAQVEIPSPSTPYAPYACGFSQNAQRFVDAYTTAWSNAQTVWDQRATTDMYGNTTAGWCDSLDDFATTIQQTSSSSSDNACTNMGISQANQDAIQFVGGACAQQCGSEPAAIGNIGAQFYCWTAGGQSQTLLGQTQAPKAEMQQGQKWCPETADDFTLCSQAFSSTSAQLCPQLSGTQDHDDQLQAVCGDGWDIVDHLNLIWSSTQSIGNDVSHAARGPWESLKRQVQSHRSPGQAYSRAPSQYTGHASHDSGHASSQNSGHAPNQNPGRAPSQNPGRAPSQNPGRAPSQNPGHAPSHDHGPAQLPDRSPAQVPDHGSSQGSDHPSSQGSDHSSSQGHDHPSGQSDHGSGHAPDQPHGRH